MFGNRQGWIISGVLVALMGLVLLQLNKLNTTTAPSRGAVDKKGTYSLKLEANPDKLEPIQIPFEPRSVYPEMTNSADSADQYRQALAEYDKDKYQYDTRTRFKTTDLAKFPALKPLLDARTSNKMSLFTAKPEEVINYNKLEPEAIKALGQLGFAANQLALMIGDTQKAEALDLIHAAFSLGFKMCQERVRYAEFLTGHQLIAESCLLIEKFDPDRATPAKAAREAMSKFVKEKILPMAYAITSIDSNVMGRTAGDIFYIIKNGKERMWRVEATLKMGYYKWNAGEPGNAADQRYARIYAKRLMNNEEDPLVKLAAKQAFELTKEQYSMIGSG